MKRFGADAQLWELSRHSNDEIRLLPLRHATGFWTVAHPQWHLVSPVRHKAPWVQAKVFGVGKV